MLVTGFDGVLFATLGVKAHTLPQLTQDRSPVLTQRVDNAPAYAGMSIGAALVPVQFQVNAGAEIEATLLNLLRDLNPDEPTLRPLTGTAAGTAWTIPAAVGGWRYVAVNMIDVDFVVPDGGWLGTTTASVVTAMSANGSQAMAATTTKRPARPIINISWPGVTNRLTANTTTGYKYRRQFTLANSGDRTIQNLAVQLGPWDTKALVTAGKMLANGNDVRIFRNGKEIRRNLVAWNWALSMIWFVPDPLAPGASATYDLVYGNASAGTPKTLTFATEPALPAFDIRGEAVPITSSTPTSVTNGAAAWQTDQWAGSTLINSDGQYRTILSNTAVTLTVTRSFSSNPTVSDNPTLMKSGIKGDGGKWAGGTGTSFIDSAQSQKWTADEWTGATLETISGTGSGQSRIVTGNTSGGTLYLTSALSPAPDTTTSYRVFRNNGQWTYDVRKVNRDADKHRGLWSINKGGTRPSQIRFDTPGSWYRGVYVRNGDAYSQPRAVGSDVGGGDIDWFATLNLQRAREGKSGTQEEVGVADMVAVSSPFGFVAVELDVLYRSATKTGSPGQGMCAFLMGAQESGGEEWDIFYDYRVDQNSSIPLAVSQSLADQGTPLRLMMTLVPNAADSIDDADNNTAQVQSDGTYWKLSINPSTLTVPDIAAAVEEAVYDVQLSLRNRGGAAGNVYPHKRIDVGGIDRKVFLAAGQKVKIDTKARTAEIVTSADVRVARIGHLIRPYDVVAAPGGVTSTRLASDWLPVKATDVTLYVTDPSGAGWGALSVQSITTDGGFF